MKVITGTSVTLIYPFASPEANEVGPPFTGGFLMIYPDTTIRLLWGSQPLMTPEAARLLAKALLRAARLAEKRTIQ